MMASESDPVETTIRYVTTVNDMGQAWAFVMERIDRVGPDPSVTISPIQQQDFDSTGNEWVRRFEVTVSGTTQEETS